MSERTPEDLLNHLVDSHWDTAARHAWRQYEERGRGAIVFPVEASGDGERQPLRYLTFSDEEAAAEGSFSTLYQLVQTYDPKEQVVIAATLPDESTVFDVYERDPAPPNA